MAENENDTQGGDSGDESQGSTWSVFQEHKRKLIQLANTRSRLKEVNQLNKTQAAELKKLNKKIRDLETKLGAKVTETEEEEAEVESKAGEPAEETVQGKGFKLFFWS